VRTHQNVALGYDVGKISAGSLVLDMSDNEPANVQLSSVVVNVA